MAPPRLRLRRDIMAAVRGGHPWVFRDAVEAPRGLAAGDVADLVGADGSFVARGVVEPESQLVFRAWTTRSDEDVDEGLLQRRLEFALGLRRAILPAGITGYRLCHGENDHVPALQCDWYDGVCSLRTDGEIGAAWEDRFVGAVQRVARPRAIVVRNPRLEQNAARVRAGRVDGPVVIDEGERRFHVDILHGQKTGFFLDQRENRTRVGSISADASVLNLFSYTGGFSVAAALAGARRVVSVDIAAPAIAEARRNFLLNGIDPSPHGFEAADAFEVLDAIAGARRDRFDIIVIDPPSFAHSRKTLERGIAAYERLNRLALSALPEGGWLATASCSSHLRMADFIELLRRAAMGAGRRLTAAIVTGAAPDHPVRIGFPEGEYLKFVLARVA